MSDLLNSPVLQAAFYLVYIAFVFTSSRAINNLYKRVYALEADLDVFSRSSLATQMNVNIILERLEEMDKRKAQDAADNDEDICT